MTLNEEELIVRHCGHLQEDLFELLDGLDAELLDEVIELIDDRFDILIAELENLFAW